MHMKRVLIVSDDAHTQAWVNQALAGLDLQSSACIPGDMQRRLLDGVADLVVLDGGRTPRCSPRSSSMRPLAGLTFG